MPWPPVSWRERRSFSRPPPPSWHRPISNPKWSCRCSS